MTGRPGAACPLHLQVGMKTLTQIIKDLESAGYREVFRAEPAGLVARNEGVAFPPEDVVIDETVRVETGSNPDGQTLVLAVSSKTTPVRGTYVVTYGPNMPAEDAKLLSRMQPATLPS